MITWLAVGVAAMIGITPISLAVTDRCRRRKARKTAPKEVPGTDLALPEEPLHSYECFGHPGPPIPLLAASLPSAPIGYGWEIVTTANSEGNPALRLAMMDMASVSEVDAIEADLVIVRRWRYALDDTYASFYRRVADEAEAEISGFRTDRYHQMIPVRGGDPARKQGEVMMANLITPMVDWARMLTLRYIVAHPDESKCNYMLIESTQGERAA